MSSNKQHQALDDQHLAISITAQKHKDFFVKGLGYFNKEQ
jgi:hypothetical protein